MISHKHKCIFIHIPKTAGMSIEATFINSLGLKFYNGKCPPLLLSYNDNINIGPSSLAHLSFYEYTKNAYCSKDQYDDYYKFSFVRNPWERVVSIYKHFNYHRVMSFNNFVKIEFPILVRELYYFVKPQVEYIYDSNGVKQVDFIGKFEDLHDDFDKVRQTLNYRIPELGYINKSMNQFNYYSRWNMRFIKSILFKKPYLIKTLNIKFNYKRKYKDLYNSDSLMKINSFYKKDIEMFGYNFN